MSLPGLGLAEPDEAPAVETTTEHTLTEGSEWRFEVAFGKNIIVKVRSTLFHSHPNLFSSGWRLVW
jgi:polyribonucleotide 5'-hydroxyl-kinase